MRDQDTFDLTGPIVGLIEIDAIAADAADQIAEFPAAFATPNANLDEAGAGELFRLLAEAGPAAGSAGPESVCLPVNRLAAFGLPAANVELQADLERLEADLAEATARFRLLLLAAQATGR